MAAMGLHFRARCPPLPMGRFGADPVAVEDEGQLVGSQLGVGPHVGSRPAHPHLPRGHGLELKVPLAGPHCVAPLRAENALLVGALRRPLSGWGGWGAGGGHPIGLQ